MVTAARKWMSVTLVAALAMGVGAGILIDRLLLMPQVYSSDRGVESSDHDHRDHGRRIMEKLRIELDLTEEQALAVEAAMSENHETARQFWQESRLEFETLRAQFRRDIRAVLTDAQNERFDQMLAERDRPGRRRGGRHSGR